MPVKVQTRAGCPEHGRTAGRQRRSPPGTRCRRSRRLCSRGCPVRRACAGSPGYEPPSPFRLQGAPIRLDLLARTFQGIAPVSETCTAAVVVGHHGVEPVHIGGAVVDDHGLCCSHANVFGQAVPDLGHGEHKVLSRRRWGFPALRRRWVGGVGHPFEFRPVRWRGRWLRRRSVCCARRGLCRGWGRYQFVLGPVRRAGRRRRGTFGLGGRGWCHGWSGRRSWLWQTRGLG